MNEKYLATCRRCHGTGTKRNGDLCPRCAGDGLEWLWLKALPRKTRALLTWWTLRQYVKQYAQRHIVKYSWGKIYRLYAESVGWPEEFRQ